MHELDTSCRLYEVAAAIVDGRVLLQVLQWRSVSPEGDPETIRKTPFMLALLNKIQAEFEAMPVCVYFNFYQAYWEDASVCGRGYKLGMTWDVPLFEVAALDNRDE